jgi:chaperonin GroEL
VHAAAVLEGDLGSRATSAPVSASCAARSTSRRTGSPRTPGLEGRVAVNRARELGAGQGLNAATGEYGDLVKQGIVDPVKVSRSPSATPPRSPACC